MTVNPTDRIAELEKALIEIRRRTALLIEQNTGRWRESVEHDRRTIGVLHGNQDIASLALAGTDTYDDE